MTSEQQHKSVAVEIMAYLQKHPMSADTLEGIAYWWLVQQSITQNVELVEQALQHLVEEGKIVRESNKNGGEVYCLNQTGNNNP